MPSRDIWTWIHYHLLNPMRLTNTRTLCTIASPLAPQHTGTEDSRLHRAGEDEETRAVSAFYRSGISWEKWCSTPFLDVSRQNCSFLLERKLFDFVDHFSLFSPCWLFTTFSQKRLDIWLHETLAPLPSPAILIWVCTTSVLILRIGVSWESLKRGIPWQRPYIKTTFRWRFWILETEFCSWEIVHEVLWRSSARNRVLVLRHHDIMKTSKGISFRSARSSLSYEVSFLWRKARLPSKVLVTDTDSICDFSYLANWHTPQVEITDLMVIARKENQNKLSLSSDMFWLVQPYLYIEKTD